MISSAAIRKFIKRPVDFHDWVKAVPEDELDEAIADLRPRPWFLKQESWKPLKHQKACFLIGVAYPQFFFQLDMGTGKTTLSIMLLRYFMQCGYIEKALVLCPTDESVTDTWCGEVPVRDPELVAVPLLGSSEDKWKALESFDYGLAVVSYQGMNHMLSSHKSKKVRTLIPDPKKIRRMTAQIGAVVADESTMLFNSTSLTFRLCRQLARHIDIRYALAGRPVGRDVTKLWAQFYFVDLGKSLGETLGLFREAFFTSKKSHFSPYPEYKFKKEMTPELNRLAAHRSIQYTESECGFKAKVVPIVKRVNLPMETQQYYNKVMERLTASEGDFVKQKNSFIQARQLASGFMGYNDDELGIRAKIEFTQNPKLDLFMELQSEMPGDRKFIIVHEFNWSGERICRELKREKVPHVWIHGGIKNSRELITRFKTDTRTRGMVLNWKKGSMSLNLQVANYLFFYESPTSPIQREQTERRPARRGQTRTVFQYDLIIRNSVEQRILDFHKEGKDLFQSLSRRGFRVMSPGR